MLPSRLDLGERLRVADVRIDRRQRRDRHLQRHEGQHRHQRIERLQQKAGDGEANRLPAERDDVLAQAAERFYASDVDRSVYELARHVERTALRLLRERKPDRRLDTNVEFYTALVLHGIGLPTELFTPTFAVGRVAGWAAHCLEQLRDGRLIRPQSVYIGPTDLHYAREAVGV